MHAKNITYKLDIFPSIWQTENKIQHKMKTYLSWWEFFQEGFSLICFAENKVWGDFHLNTSILGCDECFVSTEIFRISIQSLEKIITQLDRVNIAEFNFHTFEWWWIQKFRIFHDFKSRTHPWCHCCCLRNRKGQTSLKLTTWNWS